MPAQTSVSPLCLVPRAEDPLAALARWILATRTTDLPDLSQVTVLLPDASAARQLRRHLLTQAGQQGHSALLGPQILSLREWVCPFLPAETRVCHEYAREFILVEALSQHPALLGQANPWALAESLLELFDELTLNHIGLPRDLAEFTRSVANAYGIVDSGLAALGREASLIHTLWFAWHEQLKAHHLIDEPAAYLLGLANSLVQVDDNLSLFIAGIGRPYRAELDWLNALLKSGQARLLLQEWPDTGDANPWQHLNQKLAKPQTTTLPQAPRTDVLESVFASADLPLPQRARDCARRYPVSPLQGHLMVLAAQHPEQEACGIELQVRRWLLAGHTRIGIVTENRRLARRVRALLERADVPLQDATGWALSTTSASTIVDAWLQCVEEDFAHVPLLDLLKSPFIFADLDPDRVKAAVYRLEQDVILHENIARGLDRYRDHLLARQQRLPDWLSADTQQTLLEILERLETSSQPLLALLQDKHPAADYLPALQESLRALGISPALQQDAAGSRLLNTLERLQQGALSSALSLGWLDFRNWLGRHLERTNFRPLDVASPVQLMGLAQTSLQHFDALIIASADAAHLPGPPCSSPFFNDTVRQELGLSTATHQRAERFVYFRQLLEAAPTLLITHHREQDGEPVPPSPWLENLQAFHQLAWQAPIDSNGLDVLLASDGTRVVRGVRGPLPEVMQRPAPSLEYIGLPPRLSPGDYQLLMDCPYRFYAARCLQLAPAEEIRIALSKADYGERVHLCLQAFHAPLKGLPGPFSGPLSCATREQAIALLNAIAMQVFAADLKENFAHRGWLHQWQEQIPAYIDWAIKHNEKWQVRSVEDKVEMTLPSGLRCRGRLDRIDSGAGTLGIIDYKTGTIPSPEMVQQGEAVQLPTYALLAEASTGQSVERVEYLKLGTPCKASTLEGEELTALSAAVRERLDTLISQLRAGAALPAWGDVKSCQYCEMSGICRRQSWQDQPA